MPLVFSYGSLQEAQVQLATYGRLLEGTPESLPGWERSVIAVKGEHAARDLRLTHHANVVPSVGGTVDGMAFSVTEDELALTDAYERHASYARRQVRLLSGRDAWVYVHSAP